ncbi:MAG: hypothetical protein AMXMBFR47_07380 [Planctomycetota bacterium]
MRLTTTLLSVLAFIVAATRPAGAQTLRSEMIAQVPSALYVTHAPGDGERIFIVSRSGVVRTYRLTTNTLDPTPFVTVSNVNAGGEQGLLGMAFHPDYAANGLVYFNHNETGTGNTLIVRYARSAADPDLLDPASRAIVMRIVRPIGIHNGGWIDFGPDGYLYISVGDRGGSTLAQSLESPFGKILRIDPSGDDFPADPERNYAVPPSNPFVGVSTVPEIWAWGLRNPWRCAFDSVAGGLYIADVGSGSWEEVNYQPPASPGGENYGWPCYEGATRVSTGGACANPPPTQAPFIVYGHTQVVPPLNLTGCSITGGEVYRGCAMPELAGVYFLADYCRGWIASVRYEDGVLTDVVNRTVELTPPGGVLASLSGFGRDAYGEIYFCSLSGPVYKILPAVAPPDCNANGRADGCDIATGDSSDANGNGIPDECDSADIDGDGDVDLTDLSMLLASYGACEGEAVYSAAADFDSDGCIGLGDLAFLLAHFGG